MSECHILTVTIMTMFNVMICYPRMKVLVCRDQVYDSVIWHAVGFYLSDYFGDQENMPNVQYINTSAVNGKQSLSKN